MGHGWWARRKKWREKPQEHSTVSGELPLGTFPSHMLCSIEETSPFSSHVVREHVDCTTKACLTSSAPPPCSRLGALLTELRPE